jgi:hypothetical protein
MSACSQEPTFTALLDGMDSGVALSYFAFSGRESMERSFAAFLLLKWWVIRTS